MKKGILYLRSCTVEQGKENQLFLEQERIAETYCKANEIEIEKVISEISGDPLNKRKGIHKILDFLLDHCDKINCLVVMNQNRISRDLFTFIEFEKALNSVGIEILEIEASAESEFLKKIFGEIGKI